MSTDTTSQASATSKSTQTFITALVTNAAIAGVEIAIFFIIRNGFPRIYQPRVDLPSDKELRAKSLPKTPWTWLPSVIRADDEDIIRANGLDAYLFVRFLKLMMWIFFPIAVLTWIILLPIYGTSTSGNLGLTMFTFGNIGKDQQSRLWAPLILCYLCTFYVLFLIRREYSLFIEKRQIFLTSREWSTLPQSRTVLVTGIPDNLCNNESLQDICKHFPGGVRKIWLARDVKELENKYERRQKAMKKLESAQNKIIKLASTLVRKNKVPQEGRDPSEQQSPPQSNSKSSKILKKSNKGSEMTTTTNRSSPLDTEKQFQHHQMQLASRYISDDKRPTMRLGKLPLLGKKVDTVDWATQEVVDMNLELEEIRRGDLDKFKPKTSAFFLFNDQIAAHMFAQCLAHEIPLSMSARYINVSNMDVIWNNLNMGPYQSKLRQLISWSITIAVVIFWSIPTAFVTSISNVSALCTKISWLSWLCTLPTPINGIIQGVLPPVALMLLFALLPPFLRFLARFEGIPLRSLVEHSLQKRYFLFLFVQGFIVATLAAGIMSGISQIVNNPSSTVSLLANNLPNASIFFLTLVVTSGLSGSAGGILQIAKLAIFYIKVILLGGSPRSLWNIRYTMPNTNWGQTFPGQLLVVVIALAYSTIAPLVCGFAAFSAALWWICWKYLFLWVYEMPPWTETGGAYFKTALNQIFCGIYIEELALIGLFFLARDSQGRVSGLPQGILMIVLLLITILFQVVLSMGYSPLVDYLPLSMASQMNANEDRYAREMHERRIQQAKYAGQSNIFQDPHKATTHVNDSSANTTNNTINGDNMELAPVDSHRAQTSQEALLRMYTTGTGTSSDDTTHVNNYDSINGSQHLSVTNAVANQQQAEMDELDGISENTFNHPALYRDQPTIWLPRDKLGLSQDAVRSSLAKGIDATDEDAIINDKGKIEIFTGILPGTPLDQFL